MYFNRRSSRVGHLFQNRFLSEAVEDDVYLYTVVRYIHFNPVKAGICDSPEKYPFSSYRDYLSHGSGLTNTELILGIMGRDGFIDFHNLDEDDICLDVF